MNCFTHERVAAVGMCVACQRGVCRGNASAGSLPRLICGTCAASRAVLVFVYKVPVRVEDR